MSNSSKFSLDQSVGISCFNANQALSGSSISVFNLCKSGSISASGLHSSSLNTLWINNSEYNSKLSWIFFFAFDFFGSPWTDSANAIFTVSSFQSSFRWTLSRRNSATLETNFSASDTFFAAPEVLFTVAIFFTINHYSVLREVLLSASSGNLAFSFGFL